MNIIAHFKYVRRKYLIKLIPWFALYISSQIRVNSVIPGGTATPIMKKYLESENVQSVIRQTPRGHLAGMQFLIESRN